MKIIGVSFMSMYQDGFSVEINTRVVPFYDSKSVCLLSKFEPSTECCVVGIP